MANHHADASADRNQRTELLSLIGDDPVLTELLAVVRSRDTGDGAHDVGHLLRVATWTLRLADPTVSERDAIAAALLHDLVNLPKSSSRRSEASTLSADEAGQLLAAHGLDSRTIQQITEAIVDHSFSHGAEPRSPLGRALQDADRLEALGAIGLFRTAATGAMMGTDFFDANDPWAEHRELDDRRHTVYHFFVKLLRRPDTMTTDGGRIEARRRAAFMGSFLRQLGDELGAPPPRAPLADR
jgi:uncharacterized protein